MAKTKLWPAFNPTGVKNKSNPNCLNIWFAGPGRFQITGPVFPFQLKNIEASKTPPVRPNLRCMLPRGIAIDPKSIPMAIPNATGKKLVCPILFKLSPKSWVTAGTLPLEQETKILSPYFILVFGWGAKSILALLIRVMVAE